MADPEIVGGPKGNCRYGWFEGVLTGPRPENETLRAAQRRLNDVGLGEFDVTTDGGRFQVLPPDATLTGTQMSVDRIDSLVHALRSLVEQLPDGGDVESSLRCTEVFEDETRETLVNADSRDVRALSRVREIVDTDRRREPAHVRAIDAPKMGWGPLLLVLALLFVVGGFAAWHDGWVSRVFSASAAEIAVESGTFGDMVQADIEPKWGAYVVTLKRGSAYPETSEDIDAALSGATTAAERAAVNVVADGGLVYVRLEKEDGTVLASTSAQLRKLLSDEDGEIEVDLPGAISAHTIRLSLDSGEDE